MSSVESSQSLLIPPNPSFSPTKPSASILLNGTGRPATTVKLPSPPRTTTPLPETSAFTSFPLSSSSSIATGSSSSLASTSPLARSTSSPHPANLSTRRASTPKISFAPLPTIPNELKRRNSISIGVASRKHLIGGGGGSTAGGAGGPRNVNKIMLTDEDWENYKRHYSEKSGEAVDLGAVAMQGAKALWGKVKRRSSSQSSQSSVTSDTSSASTSGSGLTSSVSAPALSGSVSSLRTVEEDEEHHEPSSDRAGSPNRRGSLRTIPGSPPPRAGSVSSESTTSAVSDTESEFDPTELDIQPSYTPGNRQAASEATHNVKNKLLDVDGTANGEDGDATPRRLPSPPPRRADIDPIAEEEEEGRRTPGGLKTGTQWERENHEKRDKGDILGFDPERFGRALDLARKY
uniref:Uncharacterized protein n=1 Tax=Kwoniella dejecticola CBS 10117 TaxID=1296121 RepID=A0A1A5ZXB3_9TREE|nr:uncharacterized protein I303_07203 [Kwoniella dejecticola CBS 10117]OBR82443.1 hypothetical protein I303_07203 [Kwoniella dejecticola CBS 10117]